MALKIFVVLLLAISASAQQKLAINYPTRTGQVWPLYIAKEGGYYQKYGYDVSLVFGVHPAGIAMVVSGEAAMTAYTLEQAMIASSKDGSLVALGSPYKKSLFALMAGKNISSVRELKGKRIGVSQIGDAPYNYTVALLAKFGVTADCLAPLLHQVSHLGLLAVVGHPARSAQRGQGLACSAPAVAGDRTDERRIIHCD